MLPTTGRNKYFFDALLPSGRSNLVALEEKFGKEHGKESCCYLLNQMMKAGHPVWSKQQFLYTIIRNPGVHWSSMHGRPLVFSELLCSMGFPVRLSLTSPRGTIRWRACSFANIEDAPVHTCANRSRNHMVAQAGNAMNFPCVGSQLLYCLVYTRHGQRPTLSSIFALVRSSPAIESVE
jgi:hypothetical protein